MSFPTSDTNGELHSIRLRSTAVSVETATGRVRHYYPFGFKKLFRILVLMNKAGSFPRQERNGTFTLID